MGKTEIDGTEGKLSQLVGNYKIRINVKLELAVTLSWHRGKGNCQIETIEVGGRSVYLY